MSLPAQTAAQGIVENVEYTHGGIGNQWTTIDGVRYATFWDLRTRDWTEGDKVAFTWSMRSLWEGMVPLRLASDLRRIPRATVGPDQYGIQVLLPRALGAEDLAELEAVMLRAQRDCVGGLFEIEVMAGATAVTYFRDAETDAAVIRRNVAAGVLPGHTAEAAAVAQLALELWDHDSDSELLGELQTILDGNDAVKPVVLNLEPLSALLGLPASAAS